MNPPNELEVIDKVGWRITQPLQKPIVYIGSAPNNDLVLKAERGKGVDPLHAQLIASPTNAGYQLVNLGGQDILLGPSADQRLAPSEFVDMGDGFTFWLGEFSLIFHTSGVVNVHEATATRIARSANSQYIGLHLSLPLTVLKPNQALDGVLVVRNLGDRSGARFELALEGLERQCYDIEPGPILPAGAEREVLFRLFHRGNTPPAGDHQLTFRATASRAYPAEQATISQMIQFLPFHHHRLRLFPAGSEPSRSQPDEPGSFPGAVALSGQPERADQIVRDKGPSPQPVAVRPESSVVTRPDRPADIPAPRPETEPLPAEGPAPPQSLPEGGRSTAFPLKDGDGRGHSQPRISEVEMPQRGPAENEEAATVEATPEVAPIEEPAPEVTANPPPASETGPELASEIDLSPPVEGQPEAQVEPAGAQPAVDTEVLEPAAPPTMEPNEEPAQPPDSGAETAADEWWGTEDRADPADEPERPQVLRLRATSAPETEGGQPAGIEASSSSETEDWWAAGADNETDASSQEAD